MTEESLSPEEIAARYLARFDWHRARSPEPRPRTRALAIWEDWIEHDPERAWRVVLELVRLRPDDDDVLEQVWYRLRLLLRQHGRLFRERVAHLVNGNALLTRIAPPAELDPANLRPRPLDVIELVRTVLLNRLHFDAADELTSLLREDPDAALPLALEIISRGPLHGFSSWDTFRPLQDLLRDHGDTVIAGVEAAAAESVLVRRCLWRMRYMQSHPPGPGEIPPHIWERAKRATMGTTDYNSDDPAGGAHTLLPEHERIVAAWFVHEETFWAVERLDDIVRNDPELAWRIVTLLVEGAPDDKVLATIGAGELEDLLTWHGAGFIDRVEERARLDDRFRQCLSCVWQNDMSDELWARVRTAAGDPEEGTEDPWSAWDQ